MFMHIEHLVRDFAAGRATNTLGGISQALVNTAAKSSPAVAFAQRHISGPIGGSAKVSGALSAAPRFGSASFRLCSRLAVSACGAAYRTRASLTSITPTQAAKITRRIDACPTRRASFFGSANAPTCSSFAPTVTASKRMSRLGERASSSRRNKRPRYFDIACRRIEAAQKQLDMFRDARESA